MATVLKTKSEQRLEQLEALKRPLTVSESAELRRCLHAVYMKHRRAEIAEREMNGFPADTIPHQASEEVEAIAKRMEQASDDDWPLPKADNWQKHAREASDQLRTAIERATVAA